MRRRDQIRISDGCKSGIIPFNDALQRAETLKQAGEIYIKFINIKMQIISLCYRNINIVFVC